MALIEKFHVVASHHPVGASAIIEGQLVKIDSSGDIVPHAGSGTVLGVAGDTKSTDTVGLPGAADSVVIGAVNTTQDTVNRVSDLYGGRDETGASGRMTVYHGGGEFATDQFETDVTSAAVGDLLYGSTGSKLQAASLGDAVAVLTRAAGAYESGVPGVDINGDIALGGDNSNQYIEFKLLP
jgi:hypothetical protein